MTETVTIKEVASKPSGWYEITLDGDDRKPSTKNEKLAEIAQAAAGGTADVIIGTSTKGAYTNHYLNEINGVKDAGKPRVTGTRSAAAPAASGRSTETQNDIARQWAFGRAIELLMASQLDFDFPLDATQFESLKQQAQALLDGRADLNV